MPTCSTCGTKIGIEVDSMVYLLLRLGLDAIRKAVLTALFNGDEPETLCAHCFIQMLGVVNATQVMRNATTEVA